MPGVNAQGLEGKVAVVTGGTRGLGRAIAQGLAQSGADVVVASRKLEQCAMVAADVERTTGRRALAVRCNVGVWDDCDSLYEEVYREFDAVHVLVNNAGISPLYGSDLRDVSEPLWNKVIAVNLGGPFRLSALFGARMSAAEGGAIINIGSGGAIQPTPDALPYCAAKAGLHALTIGFARAYAPKVRVNAIAAGRFRTDVSLSWDVDAMSAELSRSLPLGRIAEPQEIVGTVLYLASDASTYTTGAVIPVDGGAIL